MKASSATSAKETPAPRRTARSSAKRRPTPTSAEDFALADPSDAPDPTFNAYRSDLADIALAGRVIASHYVEPAERVIVMVTPLRVAPSESAEAVRELAPGERFRLLDESVGWAWGYGGAEQRVGYVRSETIAAQ